MFLFHFNTFLIILIVRYNKHNYNYWLHCTNEEVIYAKNLFALNLELTVEQSINTISFSAIIHHCFSFRVTCIIFTPTQAMLL